MITVYVLRSLKDGKLYIGMTENLDARLKRHEQGKAPSTRNRRPLVLLHSEEFENRQQARRREKYLKSGPGHKELIDILAEGRVPTIYR
jgi:putative endonuclease